MSSVLIDWVTETHRRIREEIADNYERLGGEFRHSHQYWVNADIREVAVILPPIL